jgi:SNF family Na+-dependent transporter
MFLFQLSGVINHQIQFIDEFDFFYSIPVIIPILLLLIFISFRISKRNAVAEALNADANEEIKNLIGDDL